MPITTPLDALRYALDKGAFGVDTLSKLRTALSHFESEQLIDMEQVALAREHARDTWRHNRIEDAALWGDPPPGNDDEDTTGLGDRDDEGDDPDATHAVSHTTARYSTPQWGRF